MKIKNLFSPEELEKLRDLFWGKYSHKTKFSDTNTLPSIAELILLLNGGYKDNVWHSGKTISINASRVCIDGTIETLSNIPNHE